MAENGCKDCSQLKHIKTLARQALKKYDELRRKYKENEDQYNEVVKRLQDREGMLEDMKKLIQPAMAEHERLMFKYDIELECRTEAESIARKMTFQNQALKRQSQALLDHIGKLDVTSIPKEIIEEPIEGENESYKDYTDNLNGKIQELEEKVSAYISALGESREKASDATEENIRLKQKNEHLKQSLNQSENTLTQYKMAIMELSTMSESAFEEYEHLRKKYEIEIRRRSDTEKGIQQIKAQNEAMKKQSAVLLSNVAGNQQLTQALFKIDELEEEKSSLTQQVSELKDRVDNSDEIKNIEELEQEKSNLSTEVDELTKKLTHYEKLYENLEKRYKELEQKLEDALRPPPPPPPPLPPSISQSKGFLSKIGSKRKKKPVPLHAVGSVDQQSYNKALEEMMARINSGKPLSKTLKPVRSRPLASESESGKSGAMKELHSMLTRYKKTKNESDNTILYDKGLSDGIDAESEFAKVFKKVKRPSRDDSNDVFD